MHRLTTSYQHAFFDKSDTTNCNLVSDTLIHHLGMDCGFILITTDKEATLLPLSPSKNCLFCSEVEIDVFPHILKLIANESLPNIVSNLPLLLAQHNIKSRNEDLLSMLWTNLDIDGDAGQAQLVCFGRNPTCSVTAKDFQLFESLGQYITRVLHVKLLKLERKQKKVSAIQTIIEKKLFEIHFQPIVDINSGEPLYYEALARFSAHPIASPDKWLSQANSLGLGIELEQALIEETLRSLDKLSKHGLSINVSINMSAQFIESGRLCDLLNPRTKQKITIELTEHTPSSNYQELFHQLTQLSAQGLDIAVDDAGSGYAGLHQILVLKPDIIKLDRALIEAINEDEMKQILVSSLLGFAHQTGTSIVAEGVETLQEFDTLKRLGVQVFQGYLFSKPMRGNDVFQFHKDLTQVSKLFMREVEMEQRLAI
ncbi:EAL domain-containing protein [Colwelliaceae bacterium 6471]